MDICVSTLCFQSSWTEDSKCYKFVWTETYYHWRYICVKNWYSWVKVRKRTPKIVFYSTTEFNKRENPSFVIDTPKWKSEELVPSLDKFRYDNWDLDYSYDVVKRKPIEFIYNETGVLWEEQMGIEFSKDDWYDDLIEIRDRLYRNKSL